MDGSEKSAKVAAPLISICSYEAVTALKRAENTSLNRFDAVHVHSTVPSHLHSLLRYPQMHLVDNIRHHHLVCINVWTPEYSSLQSSMHLTMKKRCSRRLVQPKLNLAHNLQRTDAHYLSTENSIANAGTKKIALACVATLLNKQLAALNWHR
jgi:hypothetical protein